MINPDEAEKEPRRPLPGPRGRNNQQVIIKPIRMNTLIIF